MRIEFKKKSGDYMRHTQPYLINPPSKNPFELIRVPSRKMVAHTDKKGRFIKVASLTKKHAHKAKRIAKSAASALFRKAAEPKKARSVETFKKIVKMRKNPIMLVNARRHHSMKKYHKNPIAKMLSGSEVKGAGQLALDTAMVVGGFVSGKYISDVLAEKVSFLGSPAMKIATPLVLGAGVYILGSRVKRIPSRITRMLAIGVMFPAVLESYQLVKAKIGMGATSAVVPATGAYVPETGAYVPETGAYVPETGLGASYGETY
jgi:hypothetical protein